MPEATFLVTLNLDDVGPSNLDITASDIADDLESAHDVIDVKPWSRAATTPVPPTTQTTQQNNIT